jgi:type IV fimbrial biogenesis protein FimT
MVLTNACGAALGRRHRLERGFSLVEMMVVLSVMTILAVVAIPPMHELFIDVRLSSNVNELLAATTFARSEAIKRGRLVTICRSVNADSGTNACNARSVGDRNGDDWGVGWLVFVEGSSNSSGLGVVNPGDEILMRQGALPAKTHGPSTAQKISFNATGEPIGSFAGINFRFNFDGGFGRIVCINRTGRSRVIRSQSRC